MAAQSDERVMISERIAPGMLPRVLNSFDMLIWLGVLCGISVLAALLIYAISDFMHRREAPTPTPTPA